MCKSHRVHLIPHPQPPPQVPVRTTGNKSPFGPAIISSHLGAWNLISPFISAASAGLLLWVIKGTKPRVVHSFVSVSLVEDWVTSREQRAHRAGCLRVRSLALFLLFYIHRPRPCFQRRELIYQDNRRAMEIGFCTLSRLFRWRREGIQYMQKDVPCDCNANFVPDYKRRAPSKL